MPRTAMRSLGALALLATCAQASVVGIDFGSSFMKVALVRLQGTNHAAAGLAARSRFEH